MRSRHNSVSASSGLPSRNVDGSRGAMAGFDELNPRLREIIHRAPMSLTVVDVLRHQRAIGVEETARELLRFIHGCFPEWRPIEEHLNYSRASRPMRRRPGARA